jgi:HEPN domain-containing protein
LSTDQLREDVERWLRFARADIVLAESINRDPTHPPHLACYHAQQGVEKSLKAGLLWSAIEPPRRHDLDQLRVLLPQSWMIHNLHPDLGELTEWCVEARYPGDWPEATDADAQVAVNQARAVWGAILDDLERHGLDVADFR